jgi:hypothetical protein
VITLLPSQFGWTSKEIGSAISLFKSTGKAFDAIAVALYMDRPWESSIRGWTIAQGLDLVRHHLVIGKYYQPNFDEWIKNVQLYEQAIGHRVLRVAYEGGWEGPALPSGVASPWDWTQHPDRADLEKCRWLRAQQAGFDLHADSAFLLPPQLSGTWAWQGQLAGAGDGSDGRVVNQLRGKLVPGNVSPGGEAWRRWQRDYWIARTGSTGQ